MKLTGHSSTANSGDMAVWQTKSKPRLQITQVLQKIKLHVREEDRDLSVLNSPQKPGDSATSCSSSQGNKYTSDITRTFRNM